MAQNLINKQKYKMEEIDLNNKEDYKPFMPEKQTNLCQYSGLLPEFAGLFLCRCLYCFLIAHYCR